VATHFDASGHPESRRLTSLVFILRAPAHRDRTKRRIAITDSG
jgi:hypothetical protein